MTRVLIATLLAGAATRASLGVAEATPAPVFGEEHKRRTVAELCRVLRDSYVLEALAERSAKDALAERVGGELSTRPGWRRQ
jgi:hypothetical protein